MTGKCVIPSEDDASAARVTRIPVIHAEDVLSSREMTHPAEAVAAGVELLVNQLYWVWRMMPLVESVPTIHTSVAELPHTFMRWNAVPEATDCQVFP